MLTHKIVDNAISASIGKGINTTHTIAMVCANIKIIVKEFDA
ncbi:MAG: hypothetical protein Q8O24_10815 [Gallionellaceae bacterium]|nr:hypothetical protein [Gallionellaceae bacterium]